MKNSRSEQKDAGGSGSKPGSEPDESAKAPSNVPRLRPASGRKYDWPMLVRVHPSNVATAFGEELAKRQKAMGFFRRVWWRTRRRFHAAWRGVRTIAQTLYREFARAPKKSFLDLLIGLLLALFAIPDFPKRFFSLPFAWLAYLCLLLSRVLYGVWHRANMLDVALDEAGKALRKMVPVM